MSIVFKKDIIIIIILGFHYCFCMGCFKVYYIDVCFSLDFEFA